MDIYLGMGDPSWLDRPEFEGVPRCVSAKQLDEYRKIRKSNGPTFLDSGAFTLIKTYARWPFTPEQFVEKTRRQVAALGPENVVAIGQMDMMCEEVVIYGGNTKDGHFVGTRHFLGLPADATFDDYVFEHQRITVANFVLLRLLAPDLPIIPIIQGFTLAQYLRCVRMFREAGVDLLSEPLVGIGSMCRRQGTTEAKEIISAIAALGIRLHGFGVSAKGIKLYGGLLASTDSQAWSYGGRMRGGRCIHQVPRRDGKGYIAWEANCPVTAAEWYWNASASVGAAQPAMDLLDGVTAVGSPRKTRPAAKAQGKRSRSTKTSVDQEALFVA